MFFKRLSHSSIAFIYSALLLSYILHESFIKSAFFFAYHLVYSLIFICVILEQAFSNNSFFKLGNVPFVSYLGRISYGLYMLHMLAILFVSTVISKILFFDSLFVILFIKTPLSLILSIAISAISYRYYESYFLRLKQKY